MTVQRIDVGNRIQTPRVKVEVRGRRGETVTLVYEARQRRGLSSQSDRTMPCPYGPDWTMKLRPRIQRV